VGNKTTSVYYSSFDLANKINGWKRRIKALPPKPEKPRPYDSRLYKEPMMAALHDLTEIEKRIRFTRAQDILQFILAREILLSDKEKGLQIGNENEDFKLEFITPQSDRGPLSVSVPCELTVCGKTITDRVKIKNYGNFVRAAQDRRIPDLFQYFTNATESMDNLKKELNAYDDVRLVIMKLVHNFEHKMWATLNAEIHTEKQRQKDITDAMEAELKHITDAKERNKKKKIIANRRKNETYTNFETIRTVFANKLPQHKADCEELKRIRNAFMHNQYPRPQDVTLNLTEADKLCLPAVAKHIGNRAEQLVCTFIDLLNSLTTKR